MLDESADGCNGTERASESIAAREGSPVTKRSASASSTSKLPRCLALLVLQSVQNEGVGSQAALDRALRASKISGPNRGLVTELVYGTLRHRRRLDRWLEQALDRGLRGLPSEVLNALRIGAYQLALLERIPDHAAIAATIDEVRKVVGPNKVGLLNAVLRRLARQRPWTGDASSGLPPWLVKRVSDYAATLSIDGPALLRAFDERAPQHIHVRTDHQIGFEDRAAAAELTLHSIGQIPGVYRVESGHFFESEIFTSRAAIAQDGASAAVVRWAGLNSDQKVLELCAGRGAKSLFLAASGAPVTAVDVDERRLQGAQRLVERAGLTTLDTVVADAAEPLPFAAASFDLVFCDAPCSGLGTMRRRPEIRHRRIAADLPYNHALQVRIIEQAAKMVRPGGLLLYAVCSFTEEEGPMVVEHLLRNAPQWRREPSDAHWVQPFLDQRGDLRTHPLQQGVDAFYAARLRHCG